MRVRLPTTPARRDTDMLPLINVVLLLLIFFMIAGALARPEPFRIEPAKSGADAGRASGGGMLMIGREGKLALDGQVVAAGDLAALLRGGALDGALTVRADRAAPADQLISILRAAEAAGIETVLVETLARGR